MTTRVNKIISAVVAIALIVAVIILVYVNLPKQSDTDDEENIPPEANPTIFTLYYGGEQTNYTMGELERLEPYTAKGGYRKQTGTIAGWGNYTGVNITTLINTIQPALFKFSLIVVSEDGNQSFNYSTIMGNVDIYDPENASEPIGTGNMTMVLAYQYEGNYLNESNDGKLKIVFLDEHGSITQSSLWRKKVISIHVITE